MIVLLLQKYKNLIKMKYKITYNGDRTLELTEEQYLINKEYWDKQSVIIEEIK